MSKLVDTATARLPYDHVLKYMTVLKPKLKPKGINFLSYNRNVISDLCSWFQDFFLNLPETSFFLDWS